MYACDTTFDFKMANEIKNKKIETVQMRSSNLM